MSGGFSLIRGRDGYIRAQEQVEEQTQRQLITLDLEHNPANRSPSSLSLSSSPISRSTSTPPIASSSSPSPPSPSPSPSRVFHNFRKFDTPSLGTNFDFNNSSLPTQVPAKQPLAFGPRFRSQSEPLPTINSQDVQMDENNEQRPAMRRARSEFATRSPITTNTYAQQDPEFEYDTRDRLAVLLEEDLQYLEEGSQVQVQVQAESSSAGSATFATTTTTALVRTHSTASTEIVDPDSQDIMAGLATCGIKVRDFAFKQPYTSSSSSSHSSSAPPPPRTTEIFDQYRALTELDYRWTQPKRTYPVQGRTLRRLLDMGWVSEEELKARGAPMDFEELEKYNREIEIQPAYPWRPFRSSGSGAGGDGEEKEKEKEKIPNMEERMEMLAGRRVLWWHVDRMRGQQENADAWEEEMRRQVAAHIARVEVMEREMKVNNGPGPSISAIARGIGMGVGVGGMGYGSKRRLNSDDAGDAGDGTGGGENQNNDGGSVDENGAPKRRRITPEPGPSSQSQSQSQPRSSQYPFQQNPYSYPHNPALKPPAKQYPAPLHTYNPELYPDAAEAIESASQSSSQPRPVVPPPMPIVRSDTPPLDEDEGEKNETSPGRRLVHPRTMKKMKGTLSRTQTFAQLAV